MKQDTEQEMNLGLKCEKEYCIYNNERECLFEKISINELGMCDACIILSLDKEFLQKEKERQLQELERRWKATEE